MKVKLINPPPTQPQFLQVNALDTDGRHCKASYDSRYIGAILEQLD